MDIWSAHEGLQIGPCRVVDEDEGQAPIDAVTYYGSRGGSGRLYGHLFHDQSGQFVQSNGRLPLQLQRMVGV